LLLGRPRGVIRRFNYLGSHFEKWL